MKAISTKTILTNRDDKLPPVYVIAKLGTNYALCANSVNPKSWHFANSIGCTGVTEFDDFESANSVANKFINLCVTDTRLVILKLV